MSTLLFGLTGTNVAAQGAAARTAAELVKDVADETIAAIRALIVRSIREGIPPYDSAVAIRDMVGMSTPQAQAAMNYRAGLLESGLPLEKVNAKVQKYVAKKIRERALTIARSETMRALNQGSLDEWRSAQREGLLGAGATKEWSTSGLSNTCPLCEALNGMAVPLSAQFPGGGGDGPPRHPNCLPGDALVSASGGVSAVSERRYDGDLLVVHTAGGKHLPCTPNHPILTPRGWVPAHFLRIGCDVIGSRSREWEFNRRDMDDKNVPARFHEIAKTARRSEQMASAPVPLSAEDFHGDGRGSEIAVVWTDRLLWNRYNPSRQQHVRQVNLGWRTMQSAGLDRPGVPHLLGHGPFAPPRCRMCGCNLTPSHGRRHSGPMQQARFGATTNGHTVGTQQSSPDHRPATSERASKRLFGLAGQISLDQLSLRQANPPDQPAPGIRFPPFGIGALRYGKLHHVRTISKLDPGHQKVASDDLRRDAKLASDLAHGASGFVLTDRVLGIDTLFFHGSLYNMETSSGSYWANGILTHNCACSMDVNP